ncbi:MAG: DoxX family protein [Gemmatimonadales bacterium]|nr:MAG: DoxX family protein [Gemmatimonadales bacterium]
MNSSWLLILLQAVVGLGLLNVWLLRARSSTAYRGGDADSLRGEFRAYGLPVAAFWIVGGLKIAAGLVLLVGIVFPLPGLVPVAAGIVVVLMMGAIGMHLKVGDPPVRSLPAVLMLLMSAGILLLGVDGFTGATMVR